jgi:hypothetical protein
MNLPTVTSVTRTYDSPVATITLDETARHRRRMRMVSDRMENGATVAFLLDLPQARLLRHGDGLVLDDGRVIEIRAEPESPDGGKGQGCPASARRWPGRSATGTWLLKSPKRQSG